MMSYTSIADLANDLRKYAWKVPADVSLIVGVPRSGLMAAIMLGEILHKPVCSLPEYIGGIAPYLGSRANHIHTNGTKVLVLDDTVYSGSSMTKVRSEIGWRKDVLFGCVYAEGKDAKDKVDLWLVDNYNPNEELWHLYEWNILHHGKRLSERSMWDIDGLMCKEPPDERDTKAYEAYIANAVPMVIPTTPLGAVVTYRLPKYRDITAEWLQRQGVKYGQLIMPQLCMERSRRNSAEYKGVIYRDAEWARLFIESDFSQAIEIADISRKQVYCYETGDIY